MQASSHVTTFSTFRDRHFFLRQHFRPVSEQLPMCSSLGRQLTKAQRPLLTLQKYLCTVLMIPPLPARREQNTW